MVRFAAGIPLPSCLRVFVCDRNSGSVLRAQSAVSKKNGLPMFRVSPGAEIIPSSRASEILADDAP